MRDAVKGASHYTRWRLLSGRRSSDMGRNRLKLFGRKADMSSPLPA